MASRTFGFEIASDGSDYSVRLSAGGESASAPFQFDHHPDSRISQVMAELAVGDVEYDKLRDVGSHLYVGLVNGAVADLFNRVRDDAEREYQGIEAESLIIRLAVPPSLQHFPWECLYDEPRKGFVVTDPRYSLVRVVPSVTTPPRRGPSGTPLSMLVVIPEGSGLAVENELHGLKTAIAPLGDTVAMEALRGRVTPDALRERLDERDWDIVHFIGHGDTAEGVARVRLNSPDNSREGLWLPGEIFATFFARHVPRLLVLNSCLGGSQSPNRTLSGIPPFLVRQGVPAIIAMQFEIPDEVAVTFARSLYVELLGPRARGRIDGALAEARRAMFQNAGDIYHSFAMPVLYRAEDAELLFASLPSPEPAPQQPVIIVPTPTDLPNELIEAFRNRQCIPVVSPDVLRVGATRGAPLPMGPRELALKLANESEYPGMDDFTTETPADEARVWPLPSVCQHYESRNQRYKLLRAVQGAYEDIQPPAGADAVATWSMPGIICTYFDGLIEEALTGRHVSCRALQKIDQKLPGTHPSDTLVVHLRGVFKRADSLVLTEHDHERLLDRMRKISSDVTDLTREEIGRSVLYIGLHPRDPLVRRLTLALRGAPEEQRSTAQGPLFFAYPDPTAVHDPYWKLYNVTWLHLSTEEIVGKLTAAIALGGVR